MIHNSVGFVNPPQMSPNVFKIQLLEMLLNGMDISLSDASWNFVCE